MGSKINRPRDIPDKSGKYKLQNISTDKKSLKREAKSLKRSGSIKRYKIKSYKNVKVRSSPLGKLKSRKVYALYVKRDKRTGGLF